MRIRKSTGQIKLFVIRFLIISVVEFLILGLSFRRLRQAFPIPAVENGEKEMIGYIQFTGYPYAFDLVLFLFLMLSPFVTFCLIFLMTKRNKQ